MLLYEHASGGPSVSTGTGKLSELGGRDRVSVLVRGVRLRLPLGCGLAVSCVCDLSPLASIRRPCWARGDTGIHGETLRDMGRHGEDTGKHRDTQGDMGRTWRDTET